MNSQKYGPVFIFLSAFLWSLSGIFTKKAAWNGVCLATLRGIIAFLAALALVKVKGQKVRPNKVKILCAVCYFVQGMLFMCANKYTTAGNATVLQNMSPLYIILLNAIVNHEKPTKRELLVCAFLFLGVGLAFAGNLGGGASLGNIMAMVSALFYAGVYFLSKQEGADAIESLLLGNACYLFLLPLLLTDPGVLNTGPSEWAFLLIFAALSGILAWLCFAIGIKNSTALQASFIALAEPVMAPLWTFIFIGEKISALSLTGFVIVISTLVIYNLSAVKTGNPKAQILSVHTGNRGHYTAHRTR